MEHNTQLAEEWKAKGNASFKEGQYQSAVDNYTKAIELDSSKPVFFVNRAMAMMKLEKYQEAIDDCGSCLKLDPTNVKAYWRRAVSHLHCGSYSLARTDITSGLDIEPKNKQLLAELDTVNKKLIECTRKVPVTHVNSPDELPEAIRSIFITDKNTEPLKQDENIADIPENDIKSDEMAPPRTTQDFERDWKEYQRSPNNLLNYLKVLDIEKLPLLFKSSFESVHLINIIKAIGITIEQSDYEFAFDLLSIITKVKRFDLACLFLDRHESKTIKDILEKIKSHLDSQNYNSAKSIDKLFTSFGV